MGRDFTPRELLASEQYNIAHNLHSLWDLLEKGGYKYNGEFIRVCSDEELAIRKQFPLIGKLLSNGFSALYEKLSVIDGGIDVLRMKDKELASYIETGVGDKSSPLIKWFNGELDPRFHYSEHNHHLFIDYVLEEAKEQSGEQKRLYEVYKQDWYKNHGVTEQDIVSLKKEFDADVAAGRYTGSFENYELEFGYHGGEVYVCFEEFLNNEMLANRANFLEDFFWAQHITMSVDVIDGHLIAKDDEGNTLKDAKIYDFALNECLAFDEDGALSDGLGAAEPFAERLKEDANAYGVEITSIVKSVSSVLSDATLKSQEANQNKNCNEYSCDKEPVI